MSLLWCVACALLGLGSARVQLAAIFGDDMVLQTNNEYGARSFLQGRADPGEAVTVQVATTVYHTTASSSGDWKVTINPHGSTSKPFSIVVTGQAGDKHVANGVMFGDVFFCSGQSNMVFPLKLALNASAEIASASKWPNFRLFTVARNTSNTPLFNVSGRWVKSTPETIPDFSAVCFMAIRDVARLHIGQRPVGLIFSAVGGTRVEAWMSTSALRVCNHTGEVAGEGGKSLAPPTNDASVLWNAMVSPLAWYSIRATLWYQGEANAEHEPSTPLYSCLFQSMIASWRDAWRIGDFAFIFMQLPPSLPPTGSEATQTGRPEIRAAQAQAQPHHEGKTDISGMAVGIDMGGKSAWGWDHPPNKNEMARRMALQVAYVAYAQVETPAFGPREPTVAVSGEDVIINFKNSVGLALRPVSNCTTCCHSNWTFESQGSDGKWTGVMGSVAGSATCQTPTLIPKQCEGLHPMGNISPEECQQRCCDSQATTWQYKPLSKSPNKNNTCWVGTPHNCNGGTTGWQGGHVAVKGDGHVLLKGAAKNAKAIRYAWTDFVQCVLYNAGGLPAAPFHVALPAQPALRVAKEASKAPTPVAMTPPMGSNSWNFFHCNIDENAVRATGQAFVKLGLKDLGYQYVNIDDCWQVARTANGTIVPDPSRFPSGMKALADDMHSMGLKFGLYTAAHERTCQDRPGSYKHEEIDAATYCEWGIDYLKIDQCGGARWPQANTSWLKFRKGFETCEQNGGRAIVESVESCGSVDGCGRWIKNCANLWRIGGDIQATWTSVMGEADHNNGLWSLAGPGHWNDPDMLQVGNPGLSFVEAKSHFALWCIMSSPLLIGTDVAHMSNDTLAILSAAELIQFNQDPLGYQGRKVVAVDRDGTQRTAPVGGTVEGAPGVTEVWAKALKGGDVGLLLLNRDDSQSHRIKVSFGDLPGLKATSSCDVRDAWARRDLGTHQGSFETTSAVASHDVVPLRLKCT